VLEACDLHHYSMMVRPLHMREGDFVERVDRLILHHRPDGLVLTPPITDHPGLLQRLRELRVLYACVSPIERTGTIGAFIDEPEAARRMMATLLHLGHRRIAHVIGHPDHGASQWRLAGYRQALAAAGIERDPQLEVPGDFSFGGGVAAARRLFSLPRGEGPTAVFAANDDMAAGVIWAAGEHGLSVPGDVSVCGFDDTPIARQIWPTLTTIHQPSREMGRIAALQLLDTLRGRGSGAMMQAPFSLELRESTAPVQATGARSA
jgi:LacI family transcriptional regulator